MHTIESHPRFLHIHRAQAWAVFTAIIVFSAWSLAALYLPRESAPSSIQQGGKDLQAYRQIVARVHRGEDYYSAAAEELRAGGYATSSVFNWRLPTSAWLLSAFPQPEWGQVLLCLLALTALGLAHAADRRDGSVLRSLVLLVAMAGAFLWCIDGDAFFAQELWAGVLIAVSVGAFGNGQRGWGVVAGLAALAMRELALPYVLVALVLACREKRWHEVSVWIAGIVAFALFFCWHDWQVQRQLTGSELVEAEGWIQFGGPAFVIRTCQMNVWIFNLPSWVALFYLAASLLGMTALPGSLKARVSATVAIYLLALLIVGKPFNNYWGLLYVPLLPFGFVRCTRAFEYAKVARSVAPI
jgi:hypothetical protein